MLYTLDVYRHKGIASALMKNLLDYAQKNNLNRVDLSVTKDGYLLYKKLGFQNLTSPYVEMRYPVKFLEGMN